MKCKKIYHKNANLGDWVDDNVEHEEAIYSDKEETYKFCTHCKGKIYPEDEFHGGIW